MDRIAPVDFPPSPSAQPQYRRLLRKIDRRFLETLGYCARAQSKSPVYLGSIRYTEHDLEMGEAIGRLRILANGSGSQEGHARGGLGEWIILNQLKGLAGVDVASLVAVAPVSEPDLVVREDNSARGSALNIDIKTTGTNSSCASYYVVANGKKGNPHFLVVVVAESIWHDNFADLYFLHSCNLAVANEDLEIARDPGLKPIRITKGTSTSERLVDVFRTQPPGPTAVPPLTLSQWIDGDTFKKILREHPRRTVTSIGKAEQQAIVVVAEAKVKGLSGLVCGMRALLEHPP